MNSFRRSIASIRWNIVANSLQIIILLGRSILLTRWLAFETFGIYQFAAVVVGLLAFIPNWGMDGAFLHRAIEVQDEKTAAAHHFTLKLLFTTIWTGLMLLGTVAGSSGETQLAFCVLILTAAISHLTQTPSLILSRRIVHRRLALTQLLIALLTTAVSLYLAWLAGKYQSDQLALWALLSSHVVIALVNVGMMYLWRPFWKPQLAWEPAVIRYFLRFGGQNLVGNLLLQALDRVDDIWTKLYLGDGVLGVYDRAYTFATYPRELLARPVNSVVAGTYAELKGQRKELSRAFFQSNALLIRTGFWLGGILFLTAPELIHLTLTDKWLPMLDSFRLMLLFTLLDPIRMTVSDLMVTLGDAHRPIPIRLAQMGVLIAGLYLFGLRWGILGVALAVDLMLLVGIALAFRQARRYTDFSLRQLFGVPLLGLGVGLGLTISGLPYLHLPDNAWLTVFMNGLLFTLIYGLMLGLWEQKELRQWLKMLKKMS